MKLSYEISKMNPPPAALDYLKQAPVISLRQGEEKKGWVIGAALAMACGAAFPIAESSGKWVAVFAALGIFIVIATILSFIALVYSRQVLIFKEGVIVRQGAIPPWTEDWYVIPWEHVVHLDFRKGFSLYFDGPRLNRGETRFLWHVKRNERRNAAEVFRSYQHRGDLPSAVRVISD